MSDEDLRLFLANVEAAYRKRLPRAWYRDPESFPEYARQLRHNRPQKKDVALRKLGHSWVGERVQEVLREHLPVCLDEACEVRVEDIGFRMVGLASHRPSVGLH